MTVENLEINVKTNAGDSANAFKSLKSALQGVSSASGKLTGASSGVKKIGEEAKKAEKHTNNLWSSIKRIAMYRLLRTVIKEITQAFSEGLKAAYAFSSGLTTEGNRFAAALDSMKSATNQMKGQLGSALIGLLTAIAPILEKIIDLVVKVADVMSQFFAAFTGSTYLKAIRTQAEFADITASGAKSAKEWKNQLLGFDEINKLNEPSGSGTGVNLLEGYAFEDAPISEGVMRFVEKVKTLFAGLKESLSPVIDIISKGLAWAWNNVLVPLGEWTINEALPVAVDLLGVAFDFLRSALEPLWEPILKPILKALADITLTGLRELTDLLKDLAKLMRGEIDFKQFIEGLDGVKAALLGIGGFLVLMGIKTLTTKMVTLMTTVLSSSFVMKAAIAGLVAYILAKLPEAISLYKQLQEQIQTQEAAEKRWVENAVEGYKHLIETADKATADRFAGMAVGIDTTRMSVEEATKAIEEYAKSVTETQKKQDAFFEIHSVIPISEQFKSIGSQAANAFENGFGSNWNQFMKNLRDKISGLGSSMNSALRGMFGSFTSAFTSKASFTSFFSVNGYASGGMPDAGELFIANERGPELVGSLNGHSAVANNGQIEAGIEEAAYRGFVRAISSGGNRGGDVVLNINGREFARATYKDYQAAARETGGSLINNFA